jgi:cell division ATPase FtsA
MKLPFLHRAAQNSNKFLTLNINSNDVRCLAFYFDGESYKIIGSGKEPLEKASVRNGAVIDKEDVVRAVKNAILYATEDLEEKINNVIIGVGGDLCLGLITTVRLKRPGGGLIQKNEIEALYAQITEAAYIQAQNDYLQNTGDPEAEVETITSSNIYIKVDNQLVTSLEGREGQVIETAVFNAFSPSYHIKTLLEITKKVGLNIIAIGPELYCFSQWIKQNSHGLEDFVLLSVDNEYTSAAVQFGGGIVSTKNLNVGYNHFVYGISEHMGITHKEAEKVLKGYIFGKLAESETAVVRTCIMEVMDIWLLGLEILFEHFTNVKTFPPQIFLTGQGAEIKEVTSTLKSEPWTKSIPFKNFPDISRVNFSDFVKMSDATGKANGSEWLNCITMAIIFEEVNGESK